MTVVDCQSVHTSMTCVELLRPTRRDHVENAFCVHGSRGALARSHCLAVQSTPESRSSMADSNCLTKSSLKFLVKVARDDRHVKESPAQKARRARQLARVLGPWTLATLVEELHAFLAARVAKMSASTSAIERLVPSVSPFQTHATHSANVRGFLISNSH